MQLKSIIGQLTILKDRIRTVSQDSEEDCQHSQTAQKWATLLSFVSELHQHLW